MFMCKFIYLLKCFLDKYIMALFPIKNIKILTKRLIFLCLKTIRPISKIKNMLAYVQ